MRHMFAENCMKMEKNWTPSSPYPPTSTEQDNTSTGLVSMKTLNDSLKHGPLVKKHRPRRPLNTRSAQTSLARTKDVPTSVNGLYPYCLYAYKTLKKSCISYSSKRFLLLLIYMIYASFGNTGKQLYCEFL